MNEEWPIDEIFDDDYLEFYLPLLPGELSDAQATRIWEMLGLQPGSRVLDLACGHGRIANRLSRRGARVTGLDATDSFLDLARAEAAAEGLDVAYVLGDARDLSSLGRFDAVVSWFTSFRYFDDTQNQQVLRQAFGSLVAGGRLLIELNHKDALMLRHTSTSITRAAEAMMIDERSFDPLTSRSICIRTIVRDGQVRTARFFTRVFSFVELRDWMLRAGFRSVDGYAGDGSPLTPDSMRMIAVATK